MIWRIPVGAVDSAAAGVARPSGDAVADPASVVEAPDLAEAEVAVASADRAVEAVDRVAAVGLEE
jgi:hypothetical protein